MRKLFGTKLATRKSYNKKGLDWGRLMATNGTISGRSLVMVRFGLYYNTQPMDRQRRRAVRGVVLRRIGE